MTGAPGGRTAPLAAMLFAALMALYLFSFSGVPVTDDEQLFLSGAQSLANWGRLAAPQLYGNERTRGEFPGVEPLHPALAALALRAASLLPAGNVAAGFMLSGLYTALTGVCLFLLARRQGYAYRPALLAGLLFGAGTLAWPYARAFFRDTLAMLLLCAALLAHAIALSKQTSQRARRQAWVALGILLPAGMLAKNTITLALPLFGLITLWRAAPGKARSGWRWRPIVAALLLLAGLTLLSLLLPAGAALSRLSSGYYRETLRILLARPHTAFWPALFGALFSPG
ncbi:MAG: glycosyltransferase family 39 protein, partial [Chloroflexi bacterium]|nr:glycosyltransferase family 39 protein [Chloroflexota bacterium]